MEPLPPAPSADVERGEDARDAKEVDAALELKRLPSKLEKLQASVEGVASSSLLSSSADFP